MNTNLRGAAAKLSLLLEVEEAVGGRRWGTFEFRFL